jgi:hypothetical protein
LAGVWPTKVRTAYRLEFSVHCGLVRFGLRYHRLEFGDGHGHGPWKGVAHRGVLLAFHFTVEHDGKIHQHRRGARRTLAGAVADRVAVLTEIGRRQGDMLQGAAIHGFTPIPIQWARQPRERPRLPCLSIWIRCAAVNFTQGLPAATLILNGVKSVSPFAMKATKVERFKKRGDLTLRHGRTRGRNLSRCASGRGNRRM